MGSRFEKFSERAAGFCRWPRKKPSDSTTTILGPSIFCWVWYGRLRRRRSSSVQPDGGPQQSPFCG